MIKKKVAQRENKDDDFEAIAAKEAAEKEVEDEKWRRMIAQIQSEVERKNQYN